MSAYTERKAEDLAGEYDTTVEELLGQFALESTVPGICIKPGCSYSAEYEPDQREGWCEECHIGSVVSLLVLLELI
jgi:hypothetical protein